MNHVIRGVDWANVHLGSMYLLQIRRLYAPKPMNWTIRMVKLTWGGLMAVNVSEWVQVVNRR
jgi:hypothetical protein